MDIGSGGAKCSKRLAKSWAPAQSCVWRALSRHRLCPACASTSCSRWTRVSVIAAADWSNPRARRFSFPAHQARHIADLVCRQRLSAALPVPGRILSPPPLWRPPSRPSVCYWVKRAEVCPSRKTVGTRLWKRNFLPSALSVAARCLPLAVCKADDGPMADSRRASALCRPSLAPSSQNGKTKGPWPSDIDRTRHSSSASDWVGGLFSRCRAFVV